MAGCDHCGTKQGPFERLFVGRRKTGGWIRYCAPQVVRDAKGYESAPGSLECEARDTAARKAGTK